MGSTDCQRAILWHQHYPTASLMHRSVKKIKEMDAGATSRALPMGNRLLLKAWWGGGWTYSPFLEQWLWVQLESGSHFIFVFLITLPPSLALLSDNTKHVQLFFVSSWQYLQVTIFHSLKMYSKFYFSHLKKTAFRHNTKKKEIKGKKKKNWSQNLQKPTTIALIYQQLTFSEYRFKQNCH